MTHALTLPEYEVAVAIEMKKRYGITWEDACGDAEPLTAALGDGWSPEEFVAWFAERHDLEEVTGGW